MSKRYFTLNSAKTYKSRTKPYPFLIAHECQDEQRSREYVAFDDVETFLQLRDSFPHAHEIVFDRITEKQQGRLIFDFDFDEPWWGVKPHFVNPNFAADIERLICYTFQEFYNDVDCDKLQFIWLISDTTKKWSKHLIVKNVFFCEDWKNQLQTFYNLMLLIVEESKSKPPEGLGFEFKQTFDQLQCKTGDLFDLQVARNNATMRMCGSSKIGGKTLMVDERSRDQNVSFYDTLIQLYRKEDILAEQHIYERQLNKHKVAQFEPKAETNVFAKQSCLLANIDLTRSDYDFKSRTLTKFQIETAFTTFQNFLIKKTNEGDVFHIKNVMGSIINLKRDKPSPCVLSGKVHDNENAFLTVYENGCIYYHCRRGCGTPDGKSNINVGKCLVPEFTLVLK